MASAMAARGFDAAAVAGAAGVGELDAYVELHIEQGPVLEARGLRLGVVDAICRRARLPRRAARRRPTTPARRRWTRAATRSSERRGSPSRCATGPQPTPSVRATVGAVAVEPGARNVVPGRCTLAVDVRCADAARVASAEAEVAALVAAIACSEGLSASVSPAYSLAPTAMAPRVVAAIEAAAAREAHGSWCRLPSGAGHDAMVIGRHCDAGMLFVPSRGGISHSPLEWTDPADCALGARVLAGTLRELAG